MPRSFTPLPSPGFFGLPHIFAAPQDPHTCLHSRHSTSCVLKCAPKRQVREHKDANAPVCVPMCARSSFRRALKNAKRADSCSYTGDSTLDELHIIE
ncbi:hypothetical protein F8273_06480 [Bifidobacterium bifidum]|nr:hypothetical protein F8273_06480 [Bifidobacterium bifidum]